MKPSELMSLKLVNARRRNENTLVAQERRTASDEYFTHPALKTE